MTEADYVVVGAGAAGCVVAAGLAERGNSVLLLEAGGRDRNPLFRIPGLGFMVSLDPDCNWAFKTDPVADLNGRELVFLQGKVLGGSSSINGMMYNRGNPNEYDLWRQLGCKGWSYDELVPYFQRAERKIANDGASLQKNDRELPILSAFVEGAGEAGHPTLENLTATPREGFGFYHTNIKGGRRRSAARAYLPGALRTGRLALSLNTQATRILVRNGIAEGVEAILDGRPVRLFARREVVLCGGAIKSPHLLLLSGIGPADQLRSFGIELVHDAPNVGAKLQNHPCYRMQFSCREGTSAYAYTRPARAMMEGLRYAVSGSGALARTVFGAGGYMKSDARLDIPDIQVVLAGALMPPVAAGRPNFRNMLPRQDGFTAVVYQGTPYSLGSVALRSADPLAAPKIDTRFFSDGRDVEVLMAGIRRVRDIVRAPALKSFAVEEITPGELVSSDQELERAIRAAAGTAYHQSGTCAMGGQDDTVVDPELRVRGVERLRVADSSVIPRILNAGLHGPSLMIGEKAVDLLCGPAARRNAA